MSSRTSHADQVAYDTARTQWLESYGFRVLRFWNSEVLHQTEGVIEAIVQALRPTRSPRASQPPTAPPDTDQTA